MLSRNKLAVNARQGEGELDLTRSALLLPYGPGLSTAVWMACGEFLGEMEMDCRGNVEVFHSVTMIEGVELTMSPSEFGDAKTFAKVDDEDSAEEDDAEMSELERLTKVQFYHHSVA
eukprot:gene27054-32689_t